MNAYKNPKFFNAAFLLTVKKTRRRITRLNTGFKHGNKDFYDYRINGYVITFDIAGYACTGFSYSNYIPGRFAELERCST